MTSAWVASRNGPAALPGAGACAAITPRPRQRKQGMPLLQSNDRPRHSSQRRVGPANGGTTPVPRQTRQLKLRKFPVPSQNAQPSCGQETTLVPLPLHTSQRASVPGTLWGAKPIPRQNAQGSKAVAAVSIFLYSSSAEDNSDQRSELTPAPHITRSRRLGISLRLTGERIGSRPAGHRCQSGVWVFLRARA